MPFVDCAKMADAKDQVLKLNLSDTDGRLGQPLPSWLLAAEGRFCPPGPQRVWGSWRGRQGGLQGTVVEPAVEDTSGDRVSGGAVSMGRHRGHPGIWKMGRGGMLRTLRAQANLRQVRLVGMAPSSRFPVPTSSPPHRSPPATRAHSWAAFPSPQCLQSPRILSSLTSSWLWRTSWPQGPGNGALQSGVTRGSRGILSGFCFQMEVLA